MKKYFVALLAVVALMFAGQVFAQSATTNSAQNQTVGSTSAANGGMLEYAPVSSSYVRYSASTAIAPALTSSNDTCMGSSGVGASGASFSFSVGTTWKDANCKMLKDSEVLWNMGNHGAAIALLCSDDDNRYAISVSGGFAAPGPVPGTIVHVGCPMSKEEWIAQGRPTLDPATNLPVKLGSIIEQPQPKVAVVPVPNTVVFAPDVTPAKKTELQAIVLEAKQKYGIDLAIQAGTTHQVAVNN